jgi:hypothetical protein
MSGLSGEQPGRWQAAQMRKESRETEQGGQRAKSKEGRECTHWDWDLGPKFLCGARCSVQPAHRSAQLELEARGSRSRCTRGS